MARNARCANRAARSATTYGATTARPAAAVTEMASGVTSGSSGPAPGAALLGDGNLHVGSLAAADHAERGGAADGRILDFARQLAAVGDRLAVEADDDVAGSQAGAGGPGGPCESGGHWRSELRRRSSDLFGQLSRERSDFNIANRPAPHLAVFLQLAEHLASEVAWHGEPDALVAAALAVDGGVDPDQLTARVDQRASRVAGIDGRVGLDEVLVLRQADVVAPRRRHDPEGDGLVQLKRVANRQHPLRDLQSRRIAPWHRRQVARVHFHQRQIGVGIDADHLAWHFTLVGERDGDIDITQRDPALVARDDVIIGEDVAVAADDHAGAEALGRTAGATLDVTRIAEEQLEERVVGVRRVLAPDDLRRRDVGDGGDGALGDTGEVRQ